MESWHQGTEALLILGLSGGSNCRQGASVETGVCRQNHRILNATNRVGILARQFDCAFVCLGTGITEKRHIGTGVRHQPLRQFALCCGVVQVGHMVQGLDLLGNGGDHDGVRVPQGAGGNPCHKIEIFAPCGIPNATAFAPFQGDGIAGIGFHHILVKLFRGEGLSRWLDGHEGLQ